MRARLHRERLGPARDADRRRARRRLRLGRAAQELCDDLPRLRFPQITVDERRHAAHARRWRRRRWATCCTVRLKTVWWWTLGMTWTLVNLRGLEQMMYDMVDDPDELHRLMAFLRDGHLAQAGLPGAERPAQPEQRRHLCRLRRLRLDARAAAAGFRRAACARRTCGALARARRRSASRRRCSPSSSSPTSCRSWSASG